MSDPKPAPRRPRNPYVIFTQLDDDYSRRLQAWQAHRGLLLEAELEPDPRIDGRARRTVLTTPKTPRRPLDESGRQSGLILWRLFSSSHRQIAASARQFTNVERARADALSVVKNHAFLHTLRTRDAAGERFGWIMTEKAEAVLLSYHWFGTRHDRNNSLKAAQAALPRADVTAGVDDVVVGHLDSWHRFPTLDRDSEKALSSALRNTDSRPLRAGQSSAPRRRRQL